jgi:putative hydrolase of the HAD superfamily
VTAEVAAATAHVELILFDAVGTLIEPNPPAVEVYHRVGCSFRGNELSLEMIRDRFAMAFQHSARLTAIDRGGRTSEELELERWRTIVGEVFVEAGPVIAELCFTQLWRHFAEPGNWCVFPDVALTITELRGRGYRVGIASNFDQRLLTICRANDRLNEIDQVFISSQLGWSKPAHEFYGEIESICGLKPEQILLVGDDYENDVAAPQSRGWQARWLNRRATTLQPNYLRSLTELLTELP